MLQWRQVRPVPIKPRVERVDVLRRDAVTAGASARIGQVRAQGEQAGLRPGQSVQLIAGRTGTHGDAEGGIEFIYGAQGRDASISLRHTRTVKEAGLALVAVVLAGH